MYTTVMTITERLWQKGLLERHQEGNAYLYTPKASRESFLTRSVGRILDSFVPDLDEAALVHFVDSVAREQPELLARLEEILEQRRSDR